MQALDFIATARLLAGQPSRGRPLETNLRRAVSTAYYALFHCLAECCADMIVGGPGSNRNRTAWLRVYRALQHGTARNRCLERNAVANFLLNCGDSLKLSPICSPLEIARTMTRMPSFPEIRSFSTSTNRRMPSAFSPTPQ